MDRHRNGHGHGPQSPGNDPGWANDNHLTAWSMAGLACGCVVGGLLVAFTGELVFLAVPAIGALCGLALAYGTTKEPRKQSRPSSNERSSAAAGTPDGRDYGEHCASEDHPNNSPRTTQVDSDPLSRQGLSERIGRN